MLRTELVSANMQRVERVGNYVTDHRREAVPDSRVGDVDRRGWSENGLFFAAWGICGIGMPFSFLLGHGPATLGWTWGLGGAVNEGVEFGGFCVEVCVGLWRSLNFEV